MCAPATTKTETGEVSTGLGVPLVNASQQQSMRSMCPDAAAKPSPYRPAIAELPRYALVLRCCRQAVYVIGAARRRLTSSRGGSPALPAAPERESEQAEAHQGEG